MIYNDSTAITVSSGAVMNSHSRKDVEENGNTAGAMAAGKFRATMLPPQRSDWYLVSGSRVQRASAQVAAD